MWLRGWSLPQRGACAGPRPAGHPPPLHGAEVMLWVVSCDLKLSQEIGTLCHPLHGPLPICTAQKSQGNA